MNKKQSARTADLGKLNQALLDLLRRVREGTKFEDATQFTRNAFPMSNRNWAKVRAAYDLMTEKSN